MAICGNPNCGKTTIFNAITGLRQKVGNYPGVTVDKTIGTFRIETHPDAKYKLVDIPGSYSLAAFSPDEYIATQALSGCLKNESRPDVIISVIDATNLERGLYLLFQVMQVGVPIVVALNMVDLAEKRGIAIDHVKLSDLLGGVPVVPVVGSKGIGINGLKVELTGMIEKPVKPNVETYDKITEQMISDLLKTCPCGRRSRAEYLRVLFDKSGPAEKDFIKREGEDKRPYLEECRGRLIEEFGALSVAETSPLTNKAAELCRQVVTSRKTTELTTTEKIDKVVLHPVMGPIILVGLMIVVFQSIFSWAEPVMNFVDSAFGALGGLVASSMVEGPLRSLLVDGIIGGVGSVIIFLPQIVILFIFIAFLEDSGYMPRAAFIVDRLFGWCGLSGKSFIPMLSSFACAIPGIMATRTIEDRKLRIVTIMVAPLMSCSARLPVYTIMIAAFIPHKTYFGLFNSQGLLLTALYAMGIVMAVVLSFIVNRVIYKRSGRGSFVMEMPTYNLPTPRSVFIRIFSRVQSFLARAGTVIMAITIIIWAVSYFPRAPEISGEYTSRAETAEAAFVAETTALDEQIGSLSIEMQRAMPAQWTDELSACQSEADVQEKKDVLTGANPEIADLLDLAANRRILEIRLSKELNRLGNAEAGAQLSNSYFGRAGRAVAPVFAPLGWDWKITMATLASFPAREVIIATLGTIYNLGTEQDEESLSLIEKMRLATWEDGPKMGQRVFTPAVALSVMIFFALCAQCGATLVTIKGETTQWKYSLIAFSYLTILAYVSALIVYQVFSRMGY